MEVKSYFGFSSIFELRLYSLLILDSSLTPRGLAFAKALNQFLITEEMNEVDVADKLNVWSSTLRRARETAAEVKGKRYVEWRALREIETGKKRFLYVAFAYYFSCRRLRWLIL